MLTYFFTVPPPFHDRYVTKRYSCTQVVRRKTVSAAHESCVGIGTLGRRFSYVLISSPRGCWLTDPCRPQENSSQLVGQSIQTIEDFLILSSDIFATSVFSASRVLDEEGEPFEHATNLVIYGIVHNDRHQVEDKRQSSHEAMEVCPCTTSELRSRRYL